MKTLIHACKTWGIWRSAQINLLPQTLEDVDIVFNICARSGDGRLRELRLTRKGVRLVRKATISL